MAQVQPAVIVPSRVMVVIPSSDVASQEETKTATISDLQQESKAEVVEMEEMNSVAKQPADPYPNRANRVGGSGLSLSFHDICYEVPQRKCFARKPNKMILKSVRWVAACSACPLVGDYVMLCDLKPKGVAQLHSTPSECQPHNCIGKRHSCLRMVDH